MLYYLGNQFLTFLWFDICYRLIGSNSAPAVSDHAHKSLSTQADLLSQLIGEFGTTCEKLLITYRKNIIRKSLIKSGLEQGSPHTYIVHIA